MTVDVLMPCAGNADYVKESLLSALNQTYQDIAIYVIDNGCVHDLYQKVVTEIGDLRVKYIKIEKRLGMVENWQRCLNFGHSSLVAFLHDDDIWNTDYIETAVQCFHVAPETTVVHMPHFNFEGEFEEHFPHCPEYITILGKAAHCVRDFYVSTSNFSHMSALVFRRQPICFSPEKFWMADQSFFATLVHYGNLVLCDKSACHIRLSPASLTSGMNKSGSTSFESLDHIRDMLTCQLRNADFISKTMPALVKIAPAIYILRLLQASLAPPRRLALYDFGKKLLLEARKSGKLRQLKYGVLVQLVPITVWQVIINVMNKIYFKRDLAVASKISANHGK